MSGVNKVLLVGHVGKDTESRTLENGSVVSNFSMATSESYKDKTGQKKIITEWHRIVLWRGLGEIAAKYVKKGDLVSIIGKIRTRDYNKDGVTHYVTEIVADELTMLGGKQGTGSAPNGKETTNSAPSLQADNENYMPDTSDDLPF